MIDSQQMQSLSARMSEPEVKGRSPWADARRRFRRNKAAMVSLFVLILVALFAIFGNSIAVWSNEDIDFNIIGQAAELGRPSLENGHYFGTDDLGRDLFSRTVQGTQVSLKVGIIGAAIAVIVGTLYGATAGYAGGRTDAIMMRTVDILLAVPYMFVLILLLVVFGRSESMLFLGIGLLSWLGMARIVRGQTLGLKHKEFVEAARAAGLNQGSIITKHIIPNLLGPVVVYVTLTIPAVILAESFLSFLGLGVQPPMASLGSLIANGAQDMELAPWLLIFPSLVMIVTLMSFNFIGDGLRDAIDPQDR